MSHQELLVNWLKDAYAMEMTLAVALDNHAKDAEKQPAICSRIEQHAEQTRRHAELVKSCVERLGGKVSVIKTSLGNMFGAIKEAPMGLAEDELVKNALSDYASEHFEIACYRALITAAQAQGDTETATICQQILADEVAQASWLEQQLPTMVQQFYGQQASREHGR
jgi:ferritin-like metal-binding protein YciE